MKRTTDAWVSGFIGIAIFSGSLPATRAAVAGFSPVFLTSARAVIAAVLGATLLLVLRQKRPAISEMRGLAVVALGVVIGFPLLTALALQFVTSARSIVFIGLLPLATAVGGVWRGGERPGPGFWLFSMIGALAVVGFALGNSGGNVVPAGDLLMVAAILLCGLGYAEGGVLARKLGGWQVISWSLVLSFPFMSLLAAISAPGSLDATALPAWLGLAYVSVFSMLVGFVFWYRGLAIGGIAAVGQLQLIQPFLGLLLAHFLLHETVAWNMIAVAVLVAVCVAGAKRYS